MGAIVSADRNRVQLVGTLGAEPEMRIAPSGSPVLKLRFYTQEAGINEWHRVTVWGPLAGTLNQYLRKGDRLVVEGRLQTSSYEKNGEKRYSTEIVAKTVLRVLNGEGQVQK